MRRPLLLAPALIAGLIAPAPTSGTEPPAQASAPVAPASSGAPIGIYRGLGTWVDIYESAAWARPVRAVKAMARKGVRTLYLETSNYSRTRDILYPSGVSRFIHAAHRHGIKVVAWYLPGFDRPKRDLRRSMRAIKLRTPKKQRFDSFSLDIEASIVTPSTKRTRRLLSLSRRIRNRVGQNYPLGAIIPAPRGIQMAGGYWPDFPYKKLNGIYDVFLPMGYFTYHYNGGDKARSYTEQNIRIIRKETGDPTVPIHAIGGVADKTSGPEARGFVRAVRSHGLIGGSLYNWSLSKTRHWRHLKAIRPNPRQNPAQPVALPRAAPIGNVPGEATAHPAEVFFRTGGMPGTRTLSFQAFDAHAGEVDVLVNWTKVGVVQPTPAGSWGSSQSVAVPDAALKDGSRNLVAFVPRKSAPPWPEWGVRAVSLS